MEHPITHTYELTNDQRRYFGLRLIAEGWEKLQLSPDVYVYYDRDNLVKVLNYEWGYLEYDTSIRTVNREMLLPQTQRGKPQKLTVPRILKIKGSGVQFSGSFLGGNIQVYDHKRNVTFIKSYSTEGDTKSYVDIDNWLTNYIATAPPDYFDWLDDQLSQKRLRIKIKAGDIVSYNISPSEFGFARILANVYDEIKNGSPRAGKFSMFHPRSLMVAPYIFWTNTLQVDLEELVTKPLLPTVCMFDIDVYRGEMPIIGHLPLSEADQEIPYPKHAATFLTLNITKQDLEKAIHNGSIRNT